MELHQLRALVSIVDLGSFRKAAQQLHVTQAAISHSIKSLERRLGVTLLVRSTSTMRLTEAGAVLLPHARTVVETIESAGEDLAALREEGTLRLGSFASASAQFLPTLVREFHSRFPRIRLEIKEGHDLEARRWLLTGDVDVAFVVGDSDDTVFQPLCDDDFVLVAPEGRFRATATDSLAVTQLDGCALIESTGGCERVVRSALEASGITVTRSALARETSTAFALVQAGIGIAVLPRMVLPQLPNGLVTYDLRPRISRTLGLAVRPDGKPPRAVMAFITLMVDLQRSAAFGKDTSAVSASSSTPNSSKH